MGHKKIKKTIICEGCGKPVINPLGANAKTHTSRIKGVRSKCQELRDVKKRAIFYKKNGDRHKKPLNKGNEKSVMRTCLGPKCRGKKKFRSVSIHHRQCGNCLNNGYGRKAVKILI